MEDKNNNNSEFYDREMSEEIAPTAKGMLLSIDYIATVIRTTLCDIMCTTSTDMEYVEDVTSPHRKKFAKSHNVALPYRKTSSFEEMFDAVTPLQQIKVIEAKVKRNKILLDEKEEFMRKTRTDRQEKQDRERLAATKIQAIFRGYRKRPRDPSKRRPPRGPEILSQQELRDFLTELQSRLNLKPIKGLTLTGKDSKNTKRNHQLRMAGAFALQRFFHLIVARNRARHRMNRVRLLKTVRQKWILHRFFRDSLRRLANWKKEAARRDAAAVVIQNKIRAFEACRKARLKRRQRTRNRRELEAATIVQRAFRGRLSVFYFPDFASLLSKVEEAVIEAEINALMFKVSAEYHAELNRQADMELMRLEDERSRKAIEYAEWLRQQELARLRQLEKDLLAREAAEAEERRRILEEQQRLLELESMKEEDDRMRRIMEEERRLRELALMQEEDRESARLRKFWDDERRRLEEEERLRRLREEEELRRQASLRAQYAAETAEVFVREVIEQSVQRIVKQAGREDDERRLMALEDEASRLRREEDDRLNAERLRLLSEKQRREEEERRQLLALMEKEILVDIEREVVEEELRKMLQLVIEELEAQRRAEEDGQRRLLLEAMAHALSEKVVQEAIDTALLNMTESEADRLARLRRQQEEEEARLQREREAEELRQMRIADEESRLLRLRLKEMELELKRLEIMEKVDEPIDTIVGETFSLIENANFDEAENQLQAELDRLLELGDDVDKALLCSVQLLLGHVKLQLAKFAEAEALFKSSQAIRWELYTPESIQSAEATEGLASCAKKQAQYEQAVVLFGEALEITKLTISGILQPVESDIPTADPMQLHVRLLLEYAEMSIERGLYKDSEKQIKEAQEKIMKMKRMALSSTGDHDDEEDIGSLDAMLTDCEVLYAMMDKIKGHYKDAVVRYRKVHDDREAAFGLKHPKIASILGALAEIEMHRCHYKKAIEFVDLAIEINGHFFSANHPTALNYVQIRARIACMVGDYKTALEQITEALRRRKLLYPDVHPTIAECFFIAAECTRQLGNGKMAQKYYEEALEIRKKLFPGNHVSLGESNVGLAINAHSRSLNLSAIPYLEEACRHYQQVSVTMDITDFVDLEVCRIELAHAYILVGRYDDAKSSLKTVGKVLHQMVGAKHVHLANSLFVLGLYKQTLGAYFDANILYNHCEDILVELFGKGARHPLLLRTAFAASTNFRGPGYYEDAAVKLNVAFTMASELYDADSVPVAKAIYARALLMRDLGDLTEASRLLPQALKIIKDRLGMKSVLFGEILGDVGEALRLEGKYDPAALALNQALQLRKTHCGLDHYLVGETLISQGMLLLDQNKADDALQIMEMEAVPLMTKCLGANHPHTMYAKGCVGLALNTLHAVAHPPNPPTGPNTNTNTPLTKKEFSKGRGGINGARNARFGRDGICDPRGKQLIDEALAMFDSYPDCPFGDSHPWAMELGGWIDKEGDNENVSESGSDGSQSSRKHAGQKAFKSTSEHPSKFATVQGALAGLDTRANTRPSTSAVGGDGVAGGGSGAAAATIVAGGGP